MINMDFATIEAKLIAINRMNNPCDLFNIPVTWGWYPNEHSVMVVYEKATGTWYKRIKHTGQYAERNYKRLKSDKHLQPFVRRAIPLLALTDGDDTPLGKVAVSPEYVGYWVVDPVLAWDQWCWDNRYF